MTGAGGLIVMMSEAVPFPVTLAAPKVTVVAPRVEGVPDMTPVLVFKPRPAGRLGAV